MELSFVEDFTSRAQLDRSLFALPTSGLYLNSGTHPSITIDNLLQTLPKVDFQLAAYQALMVYGSYLPDRNRDNLVMDDLGFVYQSIHDGNLGNALSDPTFWLKTNFESIHLKNFIEDVKNKVYSDLNLTKRLVNNQYIYEDGHTIVNLPNDYAAWVIEPKGSDYLSFRINSFALQAMTDEPVEMYVVNQGELKATLTLNPNNGVLEFGGQPYVFSGNGRWYFIIDSQAVKVGGGWVDPLKYDGFVAYTASGIGNSPETARWSYGSRGNGIGFNISVMMDAQVYIDNNLNEMANFIRACFEYMAFIMFRHNSKNRSNREQRIIMDEKLLLFETTELQSNTVAKRYMDEKAKAFRIIQKTFDTQLFSGNDDGVLEIEIGWQ